VACTKLTKWDEEVTDSNVKHSETV